MLELDKKLESKRNCSSVMKRTEGYQSSPSPIIRQNATSVGRNGVYTSHSKMSVDSQNLSLPNLKYGTESQKRLYNDMVFQNAKSKVDSIKLKLDLAESRRQIVVEDKKRKPQEQY